MISSPDIEAPPADAGALVLFSGGQDSMTCLAWARAHYSRVAAVSFDYGQRHRVELAATPGLAAGFGVPHTQLDVPALKQIGAAALTNPGIDVAADAAGTGNVYAEKHGLPSTFVPARNAVLLSTAAALGAPHGYMHLVTGICEADDAGYPDCRAGFASDMELALQAALDDDDDDLQVVAPLLYLDKARTFALAEQLGVLYDVIESSHTCYEGERGIRWAWGYGCGECPACKTRAAGFEEYQREYAGAA